MKSEMITAFVKEERKNQELTQEELAEKANVSLRSLTAIETGKSVRKSTIEKVTQALGYKLIVRYELAKIKK